MLRVFAVYAPAHFLATHWPNLALPMPGRPDLAVHLSICGTWTVLLFLSGLWGDRRSWRAVALTHVTAACYVAIDEALQLIPQVRRHFDWDDMMFNEFGVLLGTLIAMWLRAAFDRRSRLNR